MDEFGLFNDEGCVDRGFWSLAAAQLGLSVCDPDDDLVVYRLCPEHDGEAADYCEECFADEDTDEDEEDEDDE